jgi:hypothetical protein
VLVAVDDLPWLDAASAGALVFAARRLAGHDVRFLVSRRGSLPSELETALEPAGVARPPAPAADPADFPHQEVSTMTMICRWVHADDGALVMEWTAALRRGTGGTDAADAFEASGHHADALTLAGV